MAEVNFRELPEGYRFCRTLDYLRNRKLMIRLLWVSAVMTVLPIIAGLFIVPVGVSAGYMWAHPWSILVMLIAAFAYIILHELTHGVFMLMLSGVKPTFGVKIPYAYAGSTVWFDKKSHIVIALAPVVLWTAILTALALRLRDGWFWAVWFVQITNLSGSAGDVHCAWTLLCMKGDLLIRDDGVRMRIYQKQEV